MSELNESIEALEALSAQLIEAETDVKAEETESEGKLSFEFDTAKEAEMMAEKIGCTGSHEGAEGLTSRAPPKSSSRLSLTLRPRRVLRLRTLRSRKLTVTTLLAPAR